MGCSNATVASAQRSAPEEEGRGTTEVLDTASSPSQSHCLLIQQARLLKHTMLYSSREKTRILPLRWWTSGGLTKTGG